MKQSDMRIWEPEHINKSQENVELIADILSNLRGAAPGTNLISVGGDTLVFGAARESGEPYLYECTIRRVSRNVLEDEMALQPQFQVQRSDLLS